MDTTSALPSEDQDPPSDGDQPRLFPFKLASVRHVPPSSSSSSSSSFSAGRDGSLQLLWQASDASEGVTDSHQMQGGALSPEEVSQLESMFGDESSGDEGESSGDEGE
jgi:hypothetical protein